MVNGIWAHIPLYVNQSKLRNCNIPFLVFDTKQYNFRTLVCCCFVTSEWFFIVLFNPCASTVKCTKRHKSRDIAWREKILSETHILNNFFLCIHSSPMLLVGFSRSRLTSSYLKESYHVRGDIFKRDFITDLKYEGCQRGLEGGGGVMILTPMQILTKFLCHVYFKRQNRLLSIY